ncbi:MAG: hypothetical protein KDA28_15790 [Phycisphaerales bacterium]|nr:hypothetical protein [Phycisphaerales bacterium]
MSTSLVLASSAALLLLGACGQESPPEPAPNSTGTPSSGDTDHHGGARSLGTATIGETVLEVSFGGDVTPGAEGHVDIEQTAGAAPAAVRVWIGLEDGVGSRKSKADGSDGHFHGHVQAPTTIPEGAALWIEVEQADGTRGTTSLPLGP